MNSVSETPSLDLGQSRGDTVGFMLTNRPEFHLLDTAAMHLGAAPFSIYNTSPAEQIAYLLGDAGCRVVIVEAAFLDHMRAAIESTPGVQHLIVLDAEPEGSLSLAHTTRRRCSPARSTPVRPGSAAPPGCGRSPRPRSRPGPPPCPTS